MKWFKMQSDNLDDPFIQDLICEFGGSGYLVYFGIVSMVCRDNKKDLTGKASYSWVYLRNKLSLKSKTIKNILVYISEQNKFVATFHEKKVDFHIPKILEIKDNYAKDLQVTCKKPSNHKEVEEDKEKERTCRFSFSEEDMKTAVFIFDKILSVHPSLKKPNLESWSSDIRLICERDGRTHENIRSLFTWANNHQFWKGNILSPAKLRKQWDTLEIQKSSNGNSRGASSESPFDDPETKRNNELVKQQMQELQEAQA